jgi:predicted nucleic acid-binding Zn finger protein
MMKVIQYNDFLVVEGSSSNYIVEEDFCDCRDFRFRGIRCKHQKAAILAKANGTVVYVDQFYQDLEEYQKHVA